MRRPGSDSRSTDCSLYSGEIRRLVCIVSSSLQSVFNLPLGPGSGSNVTYQLFVVTKETPTNFVVLIQPKEFSHGSHISKHIRSSRRLQAPSGAVVNMAATQKPTYFHAGCDTGSNSCYTILDHNA